MKHVRTFSESMKTETASAPSGEALPTSNTIKFHDSEFWLTFKRAGRRCLLYFIEQHQLLVLAHKYSFMVYDATSRISPVFLTLFKKKKNHNLFVLTKEVSNFLLWVGGSLCWHLPWNTHVSWLLQEAVGTEGEGFYGFPTQCIGLTWQRDPMASFPRHCSPPIPYWICREAAVTEDAHETQFRTFCYGSGGMCISFPTLISLSQVENVMDHGAFHYMTMKRRSHTTVHKQAKGHQGLPIALLILRGPWWGPSGWKAVGTIAKPF